MSANQLEFGYYLPGFSGHARPDAWRRIAEVSDGRIDALWMGDHVTLPESLEYEEYQFGSPEWAKIDTPTYDVFEVLSYLAAITDEIHLGPNVCIAPLRHPIVLAKQALTLEALSEGRLELGVGVGWLKSEFDVLGIPFEQRGVLTDEFLDIFGEALDSGEVSYDGIHYQFERTGFYPTPDRGDGPRIWIGGYSGPAFRRTAEFGDGWIIVEKTPEEVVTARNRISNAWRDFDRTGEPEICAKHDVHIGDDPAETHRNVIVGEPTEIVSEIEAYVDAGTTHFVFEMPGETIKEEVNQIETFCTEVVPAFE